MSVLGHANNPVIKRDVVFLLICLYLPGFNVVAQESDTPILEEIIVIAQKRSQNNQEVPVSISSMNSLMIEESGIFEIKELTEINPSVSFDTAQSYQNSSLKIRGVGTVGNGRTFEGSVGIFIDDVYRPRSGMALQDLLDIGSIEIMRGSQDTLFGKNTVAGAISLHSTPPSLDENAGGIEFRGGNYDLRYLSANFNAPIGTNAALRLSANAHDMDGFVTNMDSSLNYDDINREAFKIQWLYESADGLRLHLIADHASSGSNCCWGSPQVFNGPLAPVVEAYSGLNGLPFIPAETGERDRKVSLNGSPREKIKDSGVTAIINWEMEDFTLKSVTSIRSWKHNQIDGDADFVGANLLILNEPTDLDYISQEFNLGFKSGNTDWLFGVYAGWEDFWSYRTVSTSTDTDNFLNVLVSSVSGATMCLPPIVAVDCSFPPGISALLDNGDLSREEYKQNSQSLAAFVHTVTDIGDRSRFIAGLRYSNETKDGGVNVDYWYDSPIVPIVLEGLGVPDDGTPRNGFDLAGTLYSPSFDAKTKNSEITGTLAYQYLPTEDLMFYAKYDRGYKAGGVNLFREAVVTNTRTYDPEFAKSLEVGFKSEYFDGSGRSNVALFRTEFTDLQINFFDGLNFRTENTGKSKVLGFEMENQFQLSPEWRLDLAATWLDAEFSRILAPELSYLQGRDMPRAPEISGSAVLTWKHRLTSGMSLFVRGLLSYTSSHYVGADVATETKAGSYLLSDFSIGIRGAGDRWEAVAWCRNCGKENYRTIFFNSTFQSGSHNAYLNAPRRFGITLRTQF